MQCDDHESEDDASCSVTFTRHYLSSRKVMLPKGLHEFNTSSFSTDDDDELIGDSNEIDSIDSYSTDYQLNYDNHWEDDGDDDGKTNLLEESDKVLIDALAEPEAAQAPPPLDDAERLNSETMIKHRPSFELLQQSMLDSNERIVPPEVIITLLISEPKNDASFTSSVYKYQVSK